MSIYPDASILIAVVLGEGTSTSAERLLNEAGVLSSSEWVLTEIASALGIKERAGQIRSPTRVNALAACRTLVGVSAIMLPVSDAACRQASALIERSTLRGGDALHLAIAARGGATVWTLDRRMAEAGQALGLDVQLLA